MYVRDIDLRMNALMTESEPLPSDETLAAMLRENRPGAWERFFERFTPSIQFVIGWSKWHFGPHEREDVFQNTLVELRTSMVRFRGQCPLDYYVKKIAVRQCINEVRRQVRSRKVLVPIARPMAEGGWRDVDLVGSRESDPYRDIERSEEIAAMMNALALLPETCITAIRFFYIQRMSYKEIADQLGIAVNTVGSRLAKCLVRLREIMGSNRIRGDAT